MLDATCSTLDIKDTQSFSKLATAYAEKSDLIKPFIAHLPTDEGIEAAIAAREDFKNNRDLLVDVLKQQYAAYELSDKQQLHLEKLLQENTFTVTTAHQPNILTGPLYFIYKIVHAVKLADELNKKHTDKHFVPFYYMGSEDADLDELGHIYIKGEKRVWQTEQSGAVGRMHTNGIDDIIKRLKGEFGNLPFADEILSVCKDAYTKHKNIQEATLYLVNELFKSYGLLVLIPDNAKLKAVFEPVVTKELLEQFSYPLVQETNNELSRHFKVQAGGRPVNLFYLWDDGSRERIELAGNRYFVGKGKSFSVAEILEELKAHPERFSANVILRPVFQETILPNVIFIGGGGELAYWMELKAVFKAVNVPYPVMVLRNSLMLMTEEDLHLQQKMKLNDKTMFESTNNIMTGIVKNLCLVCLETDVEQKKLNLLYQGLIEKAASVDTTLLAHIAALQTNALRGLKELEKKMVRAEKRNHSESLKSVEQFKSALFPNNNLQERIENFIPFYAQYGKEFIRLIYDYSLLLEQKFTILKLTVK